MTSFRTQRPMMVLLAYLKAGGSFVIGGVVAVTVPRPDAPASGGCAPVFRSLSVDGSTMTTVSGAGGCFPQGTTQQWVHLS